MGVSPLAFAYDAVTLWHAHDTDVLQCSISGRASVLFHYKGRQAELDLGTVLLHYTGSIDQKKTGV